MDQLRKKILLVDDSPFHIARTRELLYGPGFEILECTSAVDAVEIIEELGDELDLLITDLEMPGMSGFELLEWLKKQPYRGSISILVLTGAYDLTNVIDTLKNLDVNGVLAKGGPSHHILARVNALMFPDLVEKRKYDRVSVNIPVDFGWKGDHFDGEITNLSLGGCFLVTNNLAKADEEITVLMTLPIKDTKMEVSGSVIWVVGGQEWQGGRKSMQGMGIRWRELSTANRLVMEVYIEDCLKAERLYSMLSP